MSHIYPPLMSLIWLDPKERFDPPLVSLIWPTFNESDLAHL